MVIGVTMVKDEADVIKTVIGHMLTQVDQVIVADNGSTDGTREILDSLPITVVDDPDPAYYQAEKMSALAERAREAGADWVVPFDADEIWFAYHGRLGDILEKMPAEAHIAEAWLFDHVATGFDTDAGNPIDSMPWRRLAAAPLRKVAVRAVPGVLINQGNHGARFPGIKQPLTVTGQLEIRHFPYRSAEQFVRKARNGAAAYAATNLPKHAGSHWRGYGRILDEQGEEACGDIFRKWFYREDPTQELDIEGELQPPLLNNAAPCRSAL